TLEQPAQRPHEGGHEAARCAQLLDGARRVEQLEDAQPSTQVERGVERVALHQLAAPVLRGIEGVGRESRGGETLVGARVERLDGERRHAQASRRGGRARVTREASRTRPSTASASQRQRQKWASRRSTRASKRTRPRCRSTPRETSRYSAI